MTESDKRIIQKQKEHCRQVLYKKQRFAKYSDEYTLPQLDLDVDTYEIYLAMKCKTPKEWQEFLGLDEINEEAILKAESCIIEDIKAKTLQKTDYRGRVKLKPKYFRNDYYTCPTCDAKLPLFADHCPSCSQRIVWGKEL